MGGMVEAIEEGFPQREIAEASYRFQQAVETRDKIIVGVNDFVQDDEVPIPTLYIDESTGDRQMARLVELRNTRDNAEVRRTLDVLKETARGTGNTMYPAHGLRPRLRHRRRDVRRAARGLGRVRGSAADLSCAIASGYSPYHAEFSLGESQTMKKIRVVIAKPGLDGHDRGAKVIARALRDAGMEVIYTGLRQTPEQIVGAALQEDADVIGMSILSGAHMHACPRVMELLKEKGLDDVLVLVGGIIPDVDIPKLQAIGVKGHLPARQLDAADRRVHQRERPSARRVSLNYLNR